MWRLMIWREREFEAAALAYFRAQVPVGCLQAVDGVLCFSDLDRFAFVGARLERMHRKGLLQRGAMRSIFPSYDGTPAYGLPREEWGAGHA